MKKYLFLIAFLLFAIFSFAQQSKMPDLKELKHNLKFLSSDELEGRNTNTQSEKVASLYIANQLEKYGVKPFGDDGTYFQNIPFYSEGFSKTSVIKLLNTQNQIVDELKMGVHIAKNFSGGVFESKEKYNFVFAGYGLVDETQKYNDYAKIKVDGKIVIVLSGKPANFKFEESRSANQKLVAMKTEMAIKNGAVGILFVVDKEMENYWDMFCQNSFATSFSSRQSGSVEKPKAFSLMINNATLAGILGKENKKNASVVANYKNGKEVIPFESKYTMEFNIIAETKTNNSRNVVGIIPGTDPNLKDEFITIGAHYDHTGVGRNGEVNNGADDNGSGTVSVMEAANMLANSGLNKRPIVVILYTGEEKGLVGSKFFVNNSPVFKKVNVNINLDMVARGPVDSIHVIGSGRVSQKFYDLVKEVNVKSSKMGLIYKFDDDKVSTLYRQSDHYNFSQNGVPSVFFFDNDRIDLHRPTDDFEKINFEKMVKMVKLTFDLAVEAANLNYHLK